MTNLLMACPPRTCSPRQAARGMSLIELLVGMTIGLLAVLVITQITTVWEGKKRTSTGGSDAQVNGALALQMMQRDVQMAGYGSAMSGGVGCWIKLKLGSTAQTNYRLAPVVITDGGGKAPDTLRVLGASSDNFAAPMLTASAHQRGEDKFFVVDGSNLGNRLGDLMLAVPATPCDVGANPINFASMFNISAAPVNNVIEHAVGNTGPWNQDNTGTVFPGAAIADVSYAANSTLINLGNLEATRGVTLYRDYAVTAQALTAVTTLTRGSVTTASAGTTAATISTTAPPDEMATQIVNLQAVYGKDTGAINGVADTWDTIAPTTQDGWARIIAVRIALVARSAQYETDLVTDVAPGSCAALTATSNYPKWRPDGTTFECLDVSTLPDYQHYRYRVFEVVIPLRNMLWQS